MLVPLRQMNFLKNHLEYSNRTHHLNKKYEIVHSILRVLNSI